MRSSEIPRSWGKRIESLGFERFHGDSPHAFYVSAGRQMQVLLNGLAEIAACDECTKYEVNSSR